MIRASAVPVAAPLLLLLLLPALASAQEVFRGTATLAGDRAFCSQDFELVEGNVYLVEGIGEGSCDPVVELRRSSDAQQASETDPVLAQDDDGGFEYDALAAWPCNRTGRYYVRAMAFDARRAGDVTLVVRQAPWRVLHQADAQIDATAPYLSADFELSVGTPCLVLTSDLSDGCDTVVSVRRSSDAERAQDSDVEVARNDDSTQANPGPSSVEWTCQEAGRYYVRVTPYNAEGGGTFRLVVLEAMAAAPLNESLTVGATQSTTSQVVELTAGRRYVIETCGRDPASCDPVIQLCRIASAPGGTGAGGGDAPGGSGAAAAARPSTTDPVLEENDDLEEGNTNSRIELHCETTGLYYVRIRAYNYQGTGTAFVHISER